MLNRRELSGGKRDTERGISLFMVAGGLAVLLGVAALAIDLASLYVARNEAQRAADAGALAGAKAYVESGCISGGAGACGATTFTDLAKSRAVAAAGQNSVGGVLVSSLSSNCVTATPLNLSGTDPEISVTVARTAGCGNAMPTFFARIFGILSGDVSSTATAEAYNGPNICAGCIKPFLVPNCDPASNHLVSKNNPNANANCQIGSQYAPYFVNPTSGAPVNPGPTPTGVDGETWTLHLQSDPKIPSQWYLVDVGCGQGSQVACIAGCTTASWACGKRLSTVQGNRVGQMDAVNTLIHACGFGPGTCQDQITFSGNPPVPVITGGTNNPTPALRGTTNIWFSDSLVTVAIYDGSTLNPGKQDVAIVGYMTMFIQYVQSSPPDKDLITSVILGISGCGTATPTCGSGTISGGGGSLFPIRLVRNPGT